MTGIILSGGKSSRMGGLNKAFLTVNGETIIGRTVRILKSVCDDIILVTNAPLEYLDYDIRIVTDIIKGKAAMGGIYTGLFYSSSESNFVVACDMPLCNREFIEHMIRRSEGYDIVVPRPSDGFQPLHAIYSKKCLRAMETLIVRNELRIRTLFDTFKTLTIPAEEIQSFDAGENMFFNINSPEDLDNVSVIKPQ